MVISNHLFLISAFELNTFARLLCKNRQRKTKSMCKNPLFQWLGRSSCLLPWFLSEGKGFGFSVSHFFHILHKIFSRSSSVSEREVSSLSAKMCCVLDFLENKKICSYIPRLTCWLFLNSNCVQLIRKRGNWKCYSWLLMFFTYQSGC